MLFIAEASFLRYKKKENTIVKNSTIWNCYNIGNFYGFHGASKANIKNLIPNLLASTLRYIYTNLQANWAIFQGGVAISAEVFFFKFLPSQQKKRVFCPKIGQFSTKNFKILGINKNHLNTSYVKFLGHFGHFWPFFGHFRPFLGHFWPYSFIRECADQASYPLSRYRRQLLNRSSERAHLGLVGKPS